LNPAKRAGISRFSSGVTAKNRHQPPRTVSVGHRYEVIAQVVLSFAGSPDQEDTEGPEPMAA
jgi:hypothetical protein